MAATLRDVHTRLLAMARARDEIAADAPERVWLSERIVALLDELQGLYRAAGIEDAGSGHRPDG
jgi:hypothetical protein